MDEATIEILLKARQEGLDAIRDMKDSLADLRNQAVLTNEQLTFIGAAAFTSSLGLNVLADANQRTTATTQPASAAISQAATASFTWSSAIGPLTVGLIVLAAAIAAPFIPVVVGATVIMTAFAVGVVAVTVALAAAFGPLAALTAGVVVLADRMFTTGKTAVDPLLQIEQALGKMADTWGKQALPMANQFLAALMPLLPMVQQLGSQVLSWFGQQMPTVLQITSSVAQSLFKAFEAAGPIFAAFFDGMNKNRGLFEQFFGLLLGVGLQAVNGLLQNLLALSDWFLQRLPAMAPIVQQIMGAIGGFIQGVGKVAGEVVDWFVKNWPTITNVANQAWVSIKQGWDVLQPVFAFVIPQLWSMWNDLMSQSSSQADSLRTVALGLGIVLGSLAVVVLLVAGAILEAVSLMIQLVTWAREGVTWIGHLADSADRLAKALGSIPFLGVNQVGAPGLGGGAGGGGAAFPNFSFQSGGIVGGPVGAPVMGLLHGGERVLPVGGSSDMDPTNELLAAIYQVLNDISGSVRGNGFSTAAFQSRG